MILLRQVPTDQPVYADLNLTREGNYPVPQPRETTQYADIQFKYWMSLKSYILMQLVHSGGCSNTLLTNGAIFANTDTNIFISRKLADACTLPVSSCASVSWIFASLSQFSYECALIARVIRYVLDIWLYYACQYSMIVFQCVPL